MLLKENIKTGRLFRGVVPGLVRSSIANGSSMVIYEKVHTSLTEQFGLERRDMTWWWWWWVIFTIGRSKSTLTTVPFSSNVFYPFYWEKRRLNRDYFSCVTPRWDMTPWPFIAKRQGNMSGFYTPSRRLCKYFLRPSWEYDFTNSSIGTSHFNNDRAFSGRTLNFITIHVYIQYKIPTRRSSKIRQRGVNFACFHFSRSVR